jgi:hypothetical protein
VAKWNKYLRERAEKAGKECFLPSDKNGPDSISSLFVARTPAHNLPFLPPDNITIIIIWCDIAFFRRLHHSRRPPNFPLLLTEKNNNNKKAFRSAQKKEMDGGIAGAKKSLRKAAGGSFFLLLSPE